MGTPWAVQAASHHSRGLGQLFSSAGVILRQQGWEEDQASETKAHFDFDCIENFDFFCQIFPLILILKNTLNIIHLDSRGWFFFFVIFFCFVLCLLPYPSPGPAQLFNPATFQLCCFQCL